MRLSFILCAGLTLLQGCVYWRTGVLFDDVDFVGLKDDMSKAAFYQSHTVEMCPHDEAKQTEQFAGHSVDHAVYAAFMQFAKDSDVTYVSNLTGTNKTHWLWVGVGTLTWDCFMLKGDLYK